ncbi:MAG: hypothetical protein ACI9MC_001732 [Kiritimatiellia bacterium]|jgi:hypothetical protein
MNRPVFFAMWATVALLGCSNGLQPASDDIGTGSDNGTGTGSDTGTGTGTGTETDTEDPNAIDCGADYTVNMQPFDTEECVSEVIECDDIIFGTTSGGNDFYDFRDYEGMQCMGRWGQGDADFSGPERGFYYELPADSHAEFEIWSPCGLVKASVINHPSDTCPWLGSCTSGPRLADDDDHFVMKDDAIRNPLTSFLLIESVEGKELNFKVHMTCKGR